MKSFFHAILGGLLTGLVLLIGLKVWNTDTAPADDRSYEFVSHKINQKPSVSLPAIDLTTAVDKAKNSVVHIHTTVTSRQERGDAWFFGFPNYTPESTGSGVIVKENGYIVTNNHVIEDANNIEVTLPDNRKFKAIVVGTFPQADIAVLKIDAVELPTLNYADSDKSRVGQWVLAMGHPLELKFTVTAGIISAKNRDIGILDRAGVGQDKLESFIQTDAAVNPGNSGGALVDQTGALLGINTAIASKSGYYQGYSFAIPVNTMRRIVEDIIKYGKFRRPFLGVDVLEVDEDYIAENNVTETISGVAIDHVVENGPASRAGLKEKDIILGINEVKIRNIAELSGRLTNFEINEEIKLSVLRGNKIKEFSVKLVEK